MGTILCVLNDIEKRATTIQPPTAGYSELISSRIVMTRALTTETTDH